MAVSSVSKAAKTKRSAVKTSIPRGERENVSQFRRDMIAQGMLLTHEQAYTMLLKGRKEEAQEAKEQKEQKRADRDPSIEAMTKITMSREALGLHLAAIDDRIEKSIIVVGFLERYIEGNSADFVNHSIEISIEMAREAQHEIDRLRVAAGIEAEAQVTA